MISRLPLANNLLFFSGPGPGERSLLNQRTFRAVAIAACAGVMDAAQAQSGKLGVDTGTVAISGTESGQETVNFRASAEIKLPLTSGNDRSAIAEVDDIDKPSATALIAQWDLAGKADALESDGKSFDDTNGHGLSNCPENNDISRTAGGAPRAGCLDKTEP